MYFRTIVIGAIAIVILGIYYQNYFISKHHNERRAWVTLLGTEDYFPGVLALVRSLKRANSIYPLVVMMTKDVCSDEAQQLILNEGCSIRFIEDFYPTSETVYSYPHFFHAWKKLRAFEMVDICDKCVFLDADIILLQNIDELFDLNDNISFAAVQTCTCNLRKISTFPESWKPENCPYTREQYSNNTTHDNSPANVIFNAGLFLFRPNLTIFQQMLEALNTWDLTEFKFAEQDFLNKFYHDTWTRIPFIYHGIKVFSKSHPHLWDLSKLKTIHYVNAKPWQKSDEGNVEYEIINRLWWEAYEWRSEKK
ncbi:unnamed protein product [Rotaria sordida]|uniref:glycogenin glucosyltransferase n=1 Tax=Rotaria sordida TaxID=392033 RepID=A0A814L4M2_9BILA|nr:unnamed protein product [Rotaria sordida]CAF1230312.1 unnamed protein product [Rotaria sordida]